MIHDHPGDSVEVINAIYNDGNETTEPESVPQGLSKGISAAVPDSVKGVLLNTCQVLYDTKGIHW